MAKVSPAVILLLLLFVDGRDVIAHTDIFFISCHSSEQVPRL
jgi:hypothetical protein